MLKKKKFFLKIFLSKKKIYFFFRGRTCECEMGRVRPTVPHFWGSPKMAIFWKFFKKCRYLVLYKLAGFCKAAWKGRRNLAGVHKNGKFEEFFFPRKISTFFRNRNLRTGNQRCYREVFYRCARNDNRNAIQLRSKTFGARVRNYTLTPSTSSILS